jgi:pseudaminic acid cytidylyltransferase
VKALCIIPARGGSKRIPRKNIRSFRGKPIIAWSIEAALESGLFERVVVSTDHEEIGDVARSYGAEVPFIRPASLSDDHTPLRPVINHALRTCQSLFGRTDYACVVSATAPLLNASDLRSGLEHLRAAKGKKFSIAVTGYPHPVQRALIFSQDGTLVPLMPEYRASRSQDLPAVYHDAGQFYWGKWDAFLSGLKMISEHGIGFEIPRWRAQDIDNEEDWHLAELLHQLAVHTNAQRSCL